MTLDWLDDFRQLMQRNTAVDLTIVSGWETDFTEQNVLPFVINMNDYQLRKSKDIRQMYQKYISIYILT